MVLTTKNEDPMQKCIGSFFICFYHVLSYNKNFTVKDIIGEYNRSYKDCFNHNVALEDAICYAVDNILDLYDNNIDNYKSIMIDIINTYYMYNKYLLYI